VVPQYVEYYQMRVQQLLEATGQVGRKYQHIEDLVIANGSHGALHAVERIRHMIDNYDSIELKWDGMPVVYWGRDEKGVFRMIPKNAWQYLKSGKMTTSSGAKTLPDNPKDVYNFVMGTGAATGDSARAAFATNLANIWHLLEQVSPKRGFIEGGILFYPGQMPQLNERTKTYDFKPNITAFHVPVASKLGKRIANAKMMIAATGFYPTAGSDDEQRFPGAEKLSTGDVIVQGTTYVEEMPGVDSAGLNQLEAYIKQHAQLIDNYLAPKKGLTNPGGELYTYLNKHLRTTGLLKDFKSWAETSLSPGKQQIMLSDIEGLKATLGTVEAITNMKMKMIKSLSLGLHGGILQTNPEGYAQAHPEINFKNPLPGQFIKMIDQLNWAPRKL
jgi:hypothetical protein